MNESIEAAVLALLNAPESSACPIADACVLQVGHPQPCACEFRKAQMDDIEQQGISSLRAAAEAHLSMALSAEARKARPSFIDCYLDLAADCEFRAEFARRMAGAL